MSDVTPAELAQAAAVIAQTALHLRKGESFMIVADLESDEMGHAMKRAAEAAGATTTYARLDQVRSVSTNHTGDRPHKVLPDAVRRPLQGSQASCFLASVPHQEYSMREQLIHVVSACGIRHAHMPGINVRGFVHGNKLGYDKVAGWGQGVRNRLELARTLEATSSAGTKLNIGLPTPCKWVERFGEIAPGRCISLPAGALYASPDTVSGTFVANACVGEFFGAKAGLLLRTPVRLTIEEGRVVDVHAQQTADLERDIKAMLSFAPNSDRIGLVVVGVNAGIDAPTGDPNVDQNMPGLHLVVGDPGSKETGATWSARTSFAVCAVGARVVADGSVVIDDGKIVSVL